MMREMLVSLLFGLTLCAALSPEAVGNWLGRVQMAVIAAQLN